MQAGNEAKIICADRLYSAVGPVRQNAMIRIEGGRIAEVGRFDPADAPADAVRAPIVAPGFIDLQINGACDIQFNDCPNIQGVDAIVRGARKGGTAYVLPTFITAPGTSYLAAIEAVRAAREMPGVLGLHLEGPFLNPERRGVHNPDYMRQVGDEDMRHLLEFDAGRLLVTLAPERQRPGTIRQLADAGVIVFAGHSAASSSEMSGAIEEGLSGATHLFNAMSQLTSREPGVVGSVLTSDTLYAGIIADGLHVAWSNIRLAAQLMPDRLCLVTDAMRSLEGSASEFNLDGRTIRLEGGRLTDPDGRLAGAHIAMDASVRNAVWNAGLPLEQALRMASSNPARVLGLGAELGEIKPGFKASLSLLSSELEAVGVVVDGRYFGR